MNNIYKGNLYYADLEPVIGSEQGGIRPVLIVSNNIGNRYSSTVIIVPLTSKVESKMNLPTHVVINAFEKIRCDSIALVEQVRVVDKQRLKSFLGRLPSNQLMEVDKSLIVVFGMKENWEDYL
ncbi:MAG: type II toxin-antitoxin system PemK/MazF family toxin [Bacilli bacterium]